MQDHLTEPNKASKLTRLGIGPMGVDLIKIICQYSIDKDRGLMMIASRNQVDHDNGYVCDTETLASIVRSSGAKNVVLCRDHCGPYFKDSDRHLSMQEAMASCMRTLECDINSGFDLIHIDVSRISGDQLGHARIMIERSLSMSPSIMLELGSEENVGAASHIERLAKDVEFAERYRDNIRFIVAQTGSLVRDRQVGTFDSYAVKRMTDLVHDRGFYFKEHNADYLTKTELRARWQVGVDAVNVAPQLGVLQTKVLKTACLAAGRNDLWSALRDHVQSDQRWTKWVSSPTATSDDAVMVAGHYCQGSSHYRRIIDSIDHGAYLRSLTEEVHDLLDHYLDEGS